MGKSWIAISLSMLFFVVGVLILLDQYSSIGIWFQLRDLHHETFALSSFALAIGILTGSVFARKEK
jgi:uncharacterized RDD family membrane protein YckC